jgi:dTDP-4-dehydrorhamnose 3,5-epimerase
LKFTPQSIPDIILIEPNLHGDNRGYFVENYRQDLLQDYLEYKIEFIQDNESKSSKGVLRGLHYQLPPYAQSKLIKVNEGAILDVVVDIRKSSPTFGKYLSKELSAINKHQLFIPHGFAHGFIVLSDSATFSYKVDNYYFPECERGIAFDDKGLSIDWQLPTNIIKTSNKDKKNPSLEDAKDLFN